MDDQGVGRNMTGTLLIRKSGEEVNGWDSLNGHRMSHANTQQISGSTQKDFNNGQEDTFCGPVRSISVVTIFDQWDHEQGSHGGRDGEHVCAQQHKFLLTMTDSALATAEYPTHSKQSPTLSPWNSIISRESASLWWWVTYIEPFLSWKRKSFALTP